MIKMLHLPNLLKFSLFLPVSSIAVKIAGTSKFMEKEAF